MSSKELAQLEAFRLTVFKFATAPGECTAEQLTHVYNHRSLGDWGCQLNLDMDGPKANLSLLGQSHRRISNFGGSLPIGQ